jgi:hypothetical protein
MRSMSWASPILVQQAWKAVARLIAIWRRRDYARFRLHVRLELGLLCASELPRRQAEAARILVLMAEGGVGPEIMSKLEPLVIEQLDKLNPDALEEISSWLDTAGFKGKPKAARALSPQAVVESALRSVDLEESAAELERFLGHVNIGVVRRTLTRLQALGAHGREIVLAALSSTPAPYHARAIGETVARWAATDPLLERVRGLVRDPAREPWLRFALGMVLLARGELGWIDAVGAAVSTDTVFSWYARTDHEALMALPLAPVEIACRIAASPHLIAYRDAVPILCEHADRVEARAGLKAFLHRGTSRLRVLREQAARALMVHGDWTGFPVLVGHTLVKRKAEQRLAQLPAGRDTLLFKAPPSLLTELTCAALVAGARVLEVPALLDALEGVPSVAAPDARATRVARDEAYARVLAHTDDVKVHDRIFRSLRARPSRARKLARVARTFAWGIREGRRLSGRLFQIKMVGGQDLGYTRLRGSSIHVSPLPLLREERHGEEIVRGLIAHEIGHHMYHASKEGLALWKEANKLRLSRLLNLVLDEHLERNLRSLSERAGNDLKVLSSYAFQHISKEVHGQQLLHVLGMRAFEALSSTRLGVARHKGCVKISVGEVLRRLEAGGSSFSRFFRALRMGLGDRYGDPKVKKALALFKGAGFRASSLERLFEITKELYRIFSGDTELLNIFGTHAVMAGEKSEHSEQGEGISQDEVDREVDRLLDPLCKKLDGRQNLDRVPYNTSEGTDFARLRTITPVSPNPAVHRENVLRVARLAKRIRRVFERLGLRLEPVGGRSRGRSIDRARLQAAVLRGDPRMLISRELRPRADLFVGVIIDCSGSMGVGNRMEQARLFGTLLAEAAKNLRGIDARFYGFTDRELYDAGTAERCAVSGLEAGGGNNDAGALLHAWQEASRSRRKARLLVMISDGAPTECSVGSLRQLVVDLTRRGACCAQVAVRPLDDICFPHYVEINEGELDDAVRRFGEVVTKLVGRVVGIA